MSTVRLVRQLCRKFIRLDGRRRRSMMYAGLLLGIARASIILLPFATVFRVADGTKARVQRADADPQEKVDRMVKSVRSVGNRMFPRNPCLPQAVVVHWYLRRLGLPTELRISVRKDSTGRFSAHAWVESEGEIVIGGEILAYGFVPLPPVRTDTTEG